MAGGGLYALVAYGTQNVILSGNPQMTYFYKAFKRYSHFSMENITIALEGPNEMSFDSTVDLRAKIPRYGDLLSDLMFSFYVPDIFSKYITPSSSRSTQYEFQWVRYLGAAMINTVSFSIGGQKIQEFDGSYILSRALLDLDQDSFQKWRVLVGDTEAMISPATSEYAAYNSTTNLYSGYPTVVQNTAVTTQTNRPSIFGRDIHVPLSFWFSDDFSKALPLIGLQYHECEVKITLNPINQLYTILDANGFRVNPEQKTPASIQARQNMPLYVTAEPDGSIRNFLTDIAVTPPSLDTWPTLYPRLQANFIYLPREEQVIFATRPLSYLISQVTQFPNDGLTNRNVLDVQAHNPLTRMIFIQRRSDWTYRNDFANFTNWASYPNYPYTPNPGLPPGVTYCSGLLTAAMQVEMIRSIHVLCDGNEIQETKKTDYFTEYTPYKYANGVGHPGLALYSFEINHSATQPSGSLNASRIRNFQIDLDVWPLPVNTTYTYNVDIYVENINFLEVVSGMGGLKYAL